MKRRHIAYILSALILLTQVSVLAYLFGTLDAWGSPIKRTGILDALALGSEVLCLALFALLVGYVHRYFFSPIQDLTAFAQSIAEGRFDLELNPKLLEQSTHLTELGQGLDRMRIKFRDIYDDLATEVQAKTSALSEQVATLEQSRGKMQELINDMEVERIISHTRAQDLMIYKMAVEHASDLVMIADAKGRVVYANKAVERTSGYALDDIILDRPNLWALQMSPEQYKTFWHQIKDNKKEFLGEVNSKRIDGTEYTAQLHVSPILDDSGAVKYFVDIERDITKAKEVDRVKTEFIALASHQLRTPLTGMKYFLEMLLAGDAGPLNEEQTMFIENVDESNERMIQLVNGLLNVSRLESGRLIVEPKPTDMAELVQDLLKNFQPQIKEQEIVLKLAIDPSLPILDIDPSLVGEVYKNLISNSLKYTDKGGKITIRIKQEGEWIRSEVEDTGIGIPKSANGRMFNKFFRAENVAKRVTEGNGLGLYLVKAIVESSGGAVGFDSIEKKGSTFWFTLPTTGMTPHTGEVTLT